MTRQANGETISSPISRVHIALLIVAAFATFTMPSVYAGGAEIGHAHAFFQFWLPGAGDAHHHHGSHTGVASHEHSQISLSGCLTGANDTDSDLCAQVLGSASMAASVVNDAPNISPLTSFDGAPTLATIAVGSLLLLLSLFVTFRRPPFAEVKIIGRMSIPEPPPPRAAVRTLSFSM